MSPAVSSRVVRHRKFHDRRPVIAANVRKVRPWRWWWQLTEGLGGPALPRQGHALTYEGAYTKAVFAAQEVE